LNQLLSSPDLFSVEENVVEFLKEFYVYTESITSLTRPKILRLPSASTSTTELVRLCVEKSPGNLLGCSQELFNLVPEVQSLVQQQRGSKLFACDDLSTSSDWIKELLYLDLHARVSSWGPPANTSAEFAISGAIYQQALLWHLETTFHTTTHSEMESAQDRLTRFIHLLDSLPLEAPISVTLTWPLVLFGIIAKDKAYRDSIYHRLSYMLEMFGLLNIQTSMVFLQRIWIESDSLNDEIFRPCRAVCDIGSLMTRMRMDITFV
jgi:hypothetical protein